MAPPRFPCPECGRAVASLYRDAGKPAVFDSVPDDQGQRFRYVYLRGHNSPRTGARCSGFAARVDDQGRPCPG